MTITRAISQTDSLNNRPKLNWTDNPEVKELLDIIASIIAEEYIEIAKNNQNVFIKGGEK